MRGDRRPGRRWLAPLLLAAPALLAGSAYLASNDVPVSYAGVTEVRVSAPTTLTVIDVNGTKAKVNVAQAGQELDSYHFINVVAQLTTADGAPIGGETLTFTTDASTAGSGVVCRDTTDDNGVVNCGSDTMVATSQFSGEPTKFVATFAGDGSLQKSTVSGDLTTVGDSNNN